MNKTRIKTEFKNFKIQNDDGKIGVFCQTSNWEKNVGVCASIIDGEIYDLDFDCNHSELSQDDLDGAREFLGWGQDLASLEERLLNIAINGENPSELTKLIKPRERK